MPGEKTSSRPVVLFQTVGTGGSRHPVWEALAFTIRKIRPDVIIHLCSQQTANDTLPKIKETLGDWPAQQQTFTDDNPEDLEELTLRYERRIADVRARCPGAEIHVDFTSGTKVMSAAAVAAGLAQNAARLHYAVGPRDESGRATRTDRLTSLPPDQLIARHRLNEAGLLFNRGQFEAAHRIAEQLQPTLQDETLRARAQSLEFLARVCDAWQRFDWNDASTTLRDLNKHGNEEAISKAGWDIDHISQMRNFLATAAKGKSKDQTNARLVDLLANAERCIQTARYDDAVARLYRLVEYITETRLAELGIPNTSKAKLEQLREIAPRWHETREGTATRDTKLGLRHQIDILDEAGDEIGRYLASQYYGEDPTRKHPKGPLGNALNARNESLLAHGTNPIEAKIAEPMYKLVEEALAAHLTRPKLDKLLSAARFPQCPWAPAEPLPALRLANEISPSTPKKPE